MSLRKLLGKDDKFYDLLEASAEEAKSSTTLLSNYLKNIGDIAGRQQLDEFVLSRRKDKRITSEITEELCRTFVTPLEREDIEALSRALYRIPKGVEKIVERISIHPGPIPLRYFSRQLELISQATDAVIFMVKQLRRGTQLEKVQDANRRLQHAEGEADKVMLELIREVYASAADGKEYSALREMFELFEKVIDRCRDAGNIVLQIVLKYS